MTERLAIVSQVVIPGLADIVESYLRAHPFTSKLLQKLDINPHAIWWEPWSPIKGPIGRIGPGMPETSTDWTKPEIPTSLSIGIHCETDSELVELTNLVPQDSKSTTCRKSVSSCTLRIICHMGSQVYDDLLEHGVLDRTFPEWYADGHF